MFMKLMVTVVGILVLALGGYGYAHAAVSFGSGIKITACNPDLTPSDPTKCSIHKFLHEKGGSPPDAHEVIQSTITVPSGAGILVCQNRGKNTTIPGLGGITLVSLVNGVNVLNQGNGNFQTEHRYTNHIQEFNNDVVAFRTYWGLPTDRTLCRNDNWTELLYIPNKLFVTGAIFSNCTNTDDITTCELAGTIEALCTVTGAVTATTPEWEYVCKNEVINNKP